jgi:hypothetical protein
MTGTGSLHTSDAEAKLAVLIDRVDDVRRGQEAQNATLATMAAKPNIVYLLADDLGLATLISSAIQIPTTTWGRRRGWSEAPLGSFRGDVGITVGSCLPTNDWAG